MNNTTGSLNAKQSVPFFMVVDMRKSLHYYIDELGFELKMKWEPGGAIEWCWLLLDDAAIMLQEYRANVPTETRGKGVSICFICDNALVMYKRLLSLSIKVDEPFVGNNAWVVQSKDPDGYELLFESATEVPEGTTYSEWMNRQ